MTPENIRTLEAAVAQGRYVEVTWATGVGRMAEAAMEEWPETVLAFPGLTPDGHWYITSAKWHDRGYLLPEHLVADVKMTNVWDFHWALMQRVAKRGSTI